MFHLVQLQPADSLKALAALGLKLKRKHKKVYIQQPCVAYRQSQCSIYLLRPQRCRIFECRQLQRLAAGEISESQAAEKIQTALQQVSHVQTLLAQSGQTNPKRPLSKRYEKITAEPVDHTAGEAAVQLRTELTQVMEELDALLASDFRIV